MKWKACRHSKTPKNTLKNGVYTRCRECKHISDAHYGTKHKQERQVYYSKYYSANREKIIAAVRAYAETVPGIFAKEKAMVKDAAKQRGG